LYESGDSVQPYAVLIQPGPNGVVDSEVDGDDFVEDLLPPRFAEGGGRTAVILTTSPQSEVVYELTVVNVMDLAGNPMAPPELLVDPSKATFPGTPASPAAG